MTGKSTVRQLEERHVASKVELMVWCSKIDLLAVSNVRGEVALHRLTWQKVWTLAPPAENTTVRGIAWRPDGKVIAIAYSTRDILLIDVENKETLHTTHMDSEICCISWTQEKDDQHGVKPGHMHKLKEVAPKYFNEDNTSNFLPKLPSLSRSFGSGSKNLDDNLEDSKKIKDQTHLNILIVGVSTGSLYLSVFGLFPCGVLNLPDLVGSELRNIVRADISEDLGMLLVIVVFVEKKNIRSQELRLFVFDTAVLANRACELHSLALKHGHIVSLLGYLTQTMRSISEAWETILLEMDSKLASYAAKVPEGSVSADFLDLLMFGVPTDELETFLLKELTEKGLKKLGHTIELSYTNIQKLVLKHLHSVSHSLAYHLAELRGMSRWADRYLPLGLSEDIVGMSLTASGAFLNKATEVLQVIDSSMKNYKAFFRWLYVVILRLSDERVPPEITKISQQDLLYISGFLLHFDGLVPEQNGIQILAVSAKSQHTRKLQFSLEMLGQYLLDQDLTMPFNLENNPWQKFLRENPILDVDPCIVPHFDKLSLLQQHHHLEKSIQDVFNRPNTSIGKLFTASTAINYVSIPNSGDGKLTYVRCTIENKLLFAFLDSHPSSPGFYFLEVPLGISLPRKCVNLFFDSLAKKEDDDNASPEGGSTTLQVIDVQFYLPTSLSVLLLEQAGENRSTTFVQIPTYILMEKSAPVELSCAPRVEACALLESHAFKPVDNMIASKFTVSGSRKVAVILSESRRKVRLFEMEADEEEEDDETMETTTNTTATSTANTSLSASAHTSNSAAFNTSGSRPVDTSISDAGSAMDIANS